MFIDFEKPVKELTPEEAIFLGEKAKAQANVSGFDINATGNQNKYYEYPKWIPELKIEVNDEQEEKEARKRASKDEKADDLKSAKEDDKKSK